ncbi:MAG TPA: glycoside hydrolase family 2, partial [Pelobium sp.]|nr:glycoside hydrolase family 2 [Pelobium sp.]
FLSNQSSESINILPKFRISDKQPELWNPVNGDRRNLNQFSIENSTTTVPLTLAPLQSVFIVFRNDATPATADAVNFPLPKVLQTLNTPWTVTFDSEFRGPEKPVVFNQLIDWTKSTDENIKFYSGSATYRNSFTAEKPKTGERFVLNLGDVKVMAKVKLNGKYVGGVWSAPWQVDVTNFLIPGKNEVEIDVVNTWVNRLIGDSKLPVPERKTFTLVNPYKANSPLEPSGLKGPVKLLSITDK